jgi:hypothetical protein
MASPPSDLEDSILGKLPLQLRHVAYSACFENADKLVRVNQSTVQLLRSIDPANRLKSKMGILLAPLQVSSQIRCEAIDLLLGDQTVIIYKNLYTATVNTPMILMSPHHIASWGAVINRIPVHLRSPRLTYELQHDCVLAWDQPPVQQPDSHSQIDTRIQTKRPNVNNGLVLLCQRKCQGQRHSLSQQSGQRLVNSSFHLHSLTPTSQFHCDW